MSKSRHTEVQIIAALKRPKRVAQWTLRPRVLGELINTE